MNLDYTKHKSIKGNVTITGSKSESNRLLVLQKLYPNICIKNLSNSDDTVVLQKALIQDNAIVDIHHAGTAMRFLTAYFATKPNANIVLTGSNRMKQRPIKTLVDALKSVGADITYSEKEGFPPIKIKGKELSKNKLSINANVSSQYISALLLIAPSLKNGLDINLKGKLTSIPYIQMTLSLLNKIRINSTWQDHLISVKPTPTIKENTVIVESDWSAASYYYSLMAMAKSGKIQLNYFKENSLQGDKALAEIYLNFGVKTSFIKDGIILEKITNFKQKNHLSLNLINTPDIAQTIAVTCFGLGISCDLTGLHTLKIKETDRLLALKTELQKFGAKINITKESLHLTASKSNTKISKQQPIVIKTYEDHRMAMAFAPLALKYAFTIENAKVVSKSYPDFWKHFKSIIH